MLKIKNDNIYITRGETVTLEYEAIKQDGTPYILTPTILNALPVSERWDYAILALTVKTGKNGEIVLEKYLDLEAAVMYEGVTDYSKFGFHKFETQKITEITDIAEVVSANKVYHLKDTDSYLINVLTKDSKGNFEYVVKHYKFGLLIPISWYETADLEPKEYVYDITLYYGQLRPEYAAAINSTIVNPVGFPLIEDENLVKIPLITPHLFVLEDSNNA